MFFIIGIFIAIFVVLLLLIKKNESGADKTLITWLFLIVIHHVLFYLNYTGELYKSPHWLDVELPLPILQGTLLYFYTLDLAGNTIKNKWRKRIHLTLIITLLVIPFYISTKEEIIFIIANKGVGFEWYDLVYRILISGMTYSVWSLLSIKKHQVEIQYRFSNTDKSKLLWLRSLSIGYAITCIIPIFFEGPIIFSAVVVLVLFMDFFGINQLNIFYSNNVMQAVKNIENAINSKNKNSNTISKPISYEDKYVKSVLNKEMDTENYNNMNKVMSEPKFYKNITLGELSKGLKVHANHLSQVLDKKQGNNFYSYINFLRINEFIKLDSLPGNKTSTTIYLAYDTSLSSKSNFNKHFKLVTDKTPTAFFKA